MDAFLSSLATEGHVAASTQNQALAALLFLYRRVLGIEIEAGRELTRAKRPVRLPAVLTVTEVGRLLDRMTGVPWLMAALLHGSGLRLLECATVRVKDLGFERGELAVRDGKGRKDRMTMLLAGSWRRSNNTSSA